MNPVRGAALSDRLVILVGAIAGVLGIALSAAATHVTGAGSLQIAAQFLLFHAPALLAIAALVANGAIGARLGRLSASVLIIGLALFSGDLACRAFVGRALLPMAAPTGGVLLMLGWSLVGLAAFVRPRH